MDWLAEIFGEGMAQVIAWGAGLLGDLTGNIGISLSAAAGILMLGALCAILQRPLKAPGSF